MLNYTIFNDIKSQKVNFLKDLMNGFKVYKKIRERIPEEELNYKAEDLYSILLRNSEKKCLWHTFWKPYRQI